MALESQNYQMPFSDQSLRYDDPLIIGAGALLLGYAIGSGRIDWLGKETVKIARNLGVIALGYFAKSMKEHHPQLFNQNLKVTH